jgi:hypothetical protein
MELNLDPQCDIDVGPKNIIELPFYVRPLPEDDLDAAINSQNSENLIIAIGAHPGDGEVIFVTAQRKIMVFSYSDHNIPAGPIVVVEGGQRLYLPNIGDRFEPGNPGMYLSASWLIQHSRSALLGATISTP